MSATERAKLIEVDKFHNGIYINKLNELFDRTIFAKTIEDATIELED